VASAQHAGAQRPSHPNPPLCSSAAAPPPPPRDKRLRKIAKKRAKKRAKKLQRSRGEPSGTEVEQQQPAALSGDCASLARQQEQQLDEIRASKKKSKQQQQQPAEELHCRAAPTVKKFGSWFPSATTVKGSGGVTGSVCICLFYQCLPLRPCCVSCGPRVCSRCGQVRAAAVERAAAAEADTGKRRQLLLVAGTAADAAAAGVCVYGHASRHRWQSSRGARGRQLHHQRIVRVPPHACTPAHVT
jgi:hypothetical protein